METNVWIVRKYRETPEWEQQVNYIMLSVRFGYSTEGTSLKSLPFFIDHFGVTAQREGVILYVKGIGFQL